MSVISVHITQCTVASCELFVSNYILHITNKQLRLGLTVWCSQFSVDRLIRMRSQLTLASQFAHDNFQLCGKNQVSVRLINVWGEKKKRASSKKFVFPGLYFFAQNYKINELANELDHFPRMFGNAMCYRQHLGAESTGDS